MINRARKLWVETGLPPRGKRKDAVPLMGFSIFVVARLVRQIPLLSLEVTWRNMMKKCRIQTTRRECDAGDYTAELMAEKEEVPFVDPTPPADGYHGRR